MVLGGALCPSRCSQPRGIPFSLVSALLNCCSATLLQVWPGYTAYPDFSNTDTHQWWLENLQRFHTHVPFDGLWIVSAPCWLVPSPCSWSSSRSPSVAFLASLSFGRKTPQIFVHLCVLSKGGSVVLVVWEGACGFQHTHLVLPFRCH